MENAVGTLIGGAVGLAIGLVVLAVLTLFFRWLWNITLPDVFGVKALTFWQAFRILIIASMLFGGGTRVIERTQQATADEAPAVGAQG